MKAKLQALKAVSLKRTVVAASALMLSAVAMAQTAPATPEESIGTGLTTILAIIAVGGAGLITLSLARIGWTVGAKWISRLGSKG